jgi:UPF0176 protein
MGVLGRIYLANEGVNAQFSVPTANLDVFKKSLDESEYFSEMPLKIAVEDDGRSFYKLTIKVKKKILADGMDDGSYDVTNVGKHLTAKEWNEAMEDEETVVVDIRNHYESEVGHFKGAICPDADTFSEELQMLDSELEGKKEKKVLLYCTGGIRCEKTSAFLKDKGFEDVNQLHGGIIDYARQCKAEGLESEFVGKNFVFDERVGERITSDVISDCHQCDEKCDSHVNCKNDACHLLFIQCDSCYDKFGGCCTMECRDVSLLPVEEQRELRKGKGSDDSLKVYKSRLRPNLKK